MELPADTPDSWWDQQWTSGEGFTASDVIAPFASVLLNAYLAHPERRP
jgi:hypothetical protein